MNMRLGMPLVAVVAVFQANTVLAAIYDELNNSQKATLQQGKQVVMFREDPSSEWPKVYIYQRINSTPEEAAAVFFDYELAKTYVPKLLESRISARLDKRTINVDYTVDIPWPLPDENYTVQDRLSSYDNGAAYRVNWKLVRADTTKDSVGTVRFEALGTGTIMAYYNFVTPGSALAGSVGEMASKQVVDTVNSIVRQIEGERANKRSLLDSQIQRLRAALSP